MQLHKPFAVLFSVIAVLASLIVVAADWPQWRGPKRDGISQETSLLKTWPEGGPKLLWRIDNLGRGYSTPSVFGDRLYVMSNPTDKDELVQALSIKDGSQIWSARVGSVGENPKNQNYPGARATPTIDGELLYALGSDGDLACLERSSGNIRWQKNLKSDFAGTPGVWAYAESPLVDGDKLICTPGGEEATLVALHKKSGEVIWKSAIPGGDKAAYASAIVVQTGGVKQYVQVLQNGLVGVDANTGKFLWRYEKSAKSPANIPSPIEHDGFVYSASGLGGGALVKLKVTPEGFTAEEVYFSQMLPKAIGGVVLVDGHMYGTSGGLLCVDFKTGEVKWEDRSVGAGGILYADGRLYVHGENNRQVALVEATPEAYREHGKFTPPGEPQRPDKGKAWAYPVVANGRLYIRDQNMLWCYDVRDPSAVR